MNRAIYKTAFIGICLLVVLTPTMAIGETAPSDAQIVHLLNRIGFGPVPGDIENVRRIGLDHYIELQLHPATLPRSSELESRLAALPTLKASAAELAQDYAVPSQKEQQMSPEEHKALEKRQHIIVEELTQGKILRAIMSPAQLQEVMTDFWFNHFNVFAQKGADKILISSYERDAIRPYALGKFRDLLGATAHHPAMLFYLDNWLNTDPDSAFAQKAALRQGKQVGINENYARELMELHTLGVNGGYTQTDVTSLAHILTGWGLSEGKGLEQRTGFYFDPRRHDFADQIWLGHPVDGNDPDEVDHVLDILAQNPATAKHIAYELAQYFVADEPPQSLVDRLAASFRASGGDMTVVLRTLFHAPEFWDAHYAQKKFKPPFRYVVSAFRATGIVPPGDTRLLQGAIAQMGEPLYHCLTPNGYAATNDQWLNSDALLKRIDFAQKLGSFLSADAAPMIVHTMGQNWTSNTLTIAQNAEPKTRPALLLSSPEFVYY